MTCKDRKEIKFQSRRYDRDSQIFFAAILTH